MADSNVSKESAGSQKPKAEPIDLAHRQQLAGLLAQLSPSQRRRLCQTLGQSTASGNELIAQTLCDLGITHVYGISGVPINSALGCCAAQGIRVVGTRHQQGATLMAAAQNYASGKLVAAAMVSSGPAITNALTGLLVAWDNGWPLLVIAGGCGQAVPGTFQALETTALLKDLAKARLRVSEPESITPTLVQAAQLAIHNRPGPVYVEIDAGVFSRSASLSTPVVPPQWESPPVQTAAIASAIALLQQAKRPLLVIGKGCRWSEPYLDLQALADKGIPFILSPMGQGYLPDDAPGNATPAAALALSTADVVMSVGARWNWTFRFGAELAQSAKLIQIDIHESELGRNVQPKVAIEGDAKAVLRQITAGLDAVGWRSGPETRAWQAELAEACRAKRHQYWSFVDEQRSPLNLETMMTTVAAALPKDAITILDGNYTLEAGLRLLPCDHPASRFTPGSNGCMGTGIPFAIGAKMAHPDRAVVAICGDLAFGVAAMELETAVRYRSPVVVVVANNQGHSGSYQQQQFYGPDYPERVTMFVPDAHYEQLALAFGGFGAEARTADELRTALSKAMAANIPACINVRIDPDAPSPRI